jgi:hypothetical protein
LLGIIPARRFHEPLLTEGEQVVAIHGQPLRGESRKDRRHETLIVEDQALDVLVLALRFRRLDLPTRWVISLTTFTLAGRIAG